MVEQTLELPLTEEARNYVHDYESVYVEALLDGVRLEYNARTLEKLMGWPTPQGYRIITVSPVAHSDFHTLDIIHHHSKEIFPEGIAFPYHSVVVLLIPSISAEHLRLRCTSLVDTETMTAGISLVFSDLSACSYYYRQCLDADNFQKNVKIAFFSDIAAIVLINSYPLPYKMTCLHPAMAELNTADQNNHTNLAETLYLYLLTGNSCGQTANLLSVHKNTVLYRLNQIEEKYCLNLNQISTRQWLILSYLIILHGKSEPSQS